MYNVMLILLQVQSLVDSVSLVKIPFLEFFLLFVDNKMHESINSNICFICRKFLEESFVWKIFQQLTLALQECHRRGKGRAILHRDLKPANVFLDADHNVKLGDFGLARVLQHDTSFAKTFVGTPYYMSPVSWSSEG